MENFLQTTSNPSQIVQELADIVQGVTVNANLTIQQKMQLSLVSVILQIFGEQIMPDLQQKFPQIQTIFTPIGNFITNYDQLMQTLENLKMSPAST